MRLLFCSEFYFPSVGGVQEVMRQIAERMVLRGHDVTVATSRIADRKSLEHNGVKIAEFGVSGNLVRGIEGEIERYREFVRTFDCDAILIKAAQQWTFDALWPDLDQLSARKVFIPCGFSGLYEPTYIGYFEKMPDVLRKFDHLIFYAEHYRDIDFTRRHGIKNYSIVGNGASEIEFGAPADPAFRARHGIPDDSAVLLTVGSMTGVKGHRELMEAFARLKSRRRHVTFIMNGNPPPRPVVVTVAPAVGVHPVNSQPNFEGSPPRWVRLQTMLKDEGIRGFGRRISIRSRRYKDLAGNVGRIFGSEGFRGLRIRLLQRLGPWLEAKGYGRYLSRALLEVTNPIAYWSGEAKKDPERKLLIVSDFARDELVQAYKAANLFVFASNIEYSPLVLFESVAAGTPFLSVPVGNAEEICKWTQGGIICPADKDERGYTRVKPNFLATQIASAIDDPERLAALGRAGHAAWSERFTWDAIATRYEALLAGKEQSSATEVS